MELDMELVNHPKHYQRGGKECIQVMGEDLGIIAVYCHCACSDFKYLWRSGLKDGNPAPQDDAKGDWYITYAFKKYQSLVWWKKLFIRLVFPKVYSRVVNRFSGSYTK